MVILFQRLSHAHKTSSNMKQIHNSSESFSASLHSFESEVFKYMTQSITSKTGSEETYSFSWIQTCIGVLPSIDKSFATFIAEIDFPISKWKSYIVEEYLKGNSSLLDYFNCISSSVNHMSQACMELLHALSISKNLKEIQPWSARKKFEENQQEDKQEERFFSEKEMIVYKALIVRNHVQNCICRTIDLSIRGDVGEKCEVLHNTSFATVQSGVVKEVGEINKDVAHLLSREGRIDEEANELKGKVEMLRKVLEEVKQDVNRLFSEVMVRRNELLDNLRNRKL